jgi:hypothetical protein
LAFISVQCSDFAAEFRGRCSPFFLFHPGSNPFQSCASFSLGFFYLILQRTRPLIYSSDIANRPKYPARKMDSTIVLRTGVKSENPFSISQDVSGQSHAHACVDSLSNRFSRYLKFRSATEELFLHGFLDHENAVSDLEGYFGKLSLKYCFRNQSIILLVELQL